MWIGLPIHIINPVDKTKLSLADCFDILDILQSSIQLNSGSKDNNRFSVQEHSLVPEF